MPDQHNLPEEAVEAMARWLYERYERSPLVGARSWSQLKSKQRKALRRRAKVSLQAAAPALRKQGIEEERRQLEAEFRKMAANAKRIAVSCPPDSRGALAERVRSRTYEEAADFLSEDPRALEEAAIEAREESLGEAQVERRIEREGGPDA